MFTFCKRLLKPQPQSEAPAIKVKRLVEVFPRMQEGALVGVFEAKQHVVFGAMPDVVEYQFAEMAIAKAVAGRVAGEELESAVTKRRSKGVLAAGDERVFDVQRSSQHRHKTIFPRDQNSLGPLPRIERATNVIFQKQTAV